MRRVGNWCGSAWKRASGTQALQAPPPLPPFNGSQLQAHRGALPPSTPPPKHAAPLATAPQPQPRTQAGGGALPYRTRPSPLKKAPHAVTSQKKRPAGGARHCFFAENILQCSPSRHFLASEQSSTHAPSTHRFGQHWRLLGQCDRQHPPALREPDAAQDYFLRHGYTLL